MEKQKQAEQGNQVILRMSSAVEDAPYVVESIKAVDAELVASCSPDQETVQSLPVDRPELGRK